MVAISKSAASSALKPNWQTTFLQMLPVIRRYARVAFRGLPAQRRDDAVSEVVANCCAAVHRLAERGRLHDAHPTVLARFAICHVRSGREVGESMNVRDVSSRYAQQRKRFSVESLDRFDLADDAWRQIIVEDQRAGPAETAAMRIDFSDWLKSLKPRMRRIAKFLATGETTKNAARKFGVSHGRVSQLRRELQQAWLAFQGELAVA